MYRLSTNPQIIALTTSHKGRRINLSDLSPAVVDGCKACVWCLKLLKGRQLKWCSTECTSMANSWANPQKEGGLHILLVRQDFKCATCTFDYMPFVLDTLKYLNKNHCTVSPDSIRDKISERLAKILKYKVPTEKGLEVDHILPISKGGQGIGFENHQILCRSCHLSKSKVDNSGPRKKKI
jgi:hypothetical protein